MWNGRTALVTGAGGFIGSHLSEQLVRRGANVRAIVHYRGSGARGWLDGSPLADEMEVVAGDIRDSDQMRSVMRGVDTVFHLAALIGIPYSYRAPRSYVDTNVTGTLNVLQAGLDGGIRRIVHTSTSEVYGSAMYVPIDESHPLSAQSPYAASKIGADQMAAAYHRSFGLSVATIRPFNCYGPRQSARAVIPTIITQAQTRPSVELGSLFPLRDLTFVEDTAESFIRMAEADAVVGEVVNVGSSQEISIGDLATLIVRLLGKNVPIVERSERVRPDASEVVHLRADCGKAARLLGWEPRVSLEEGLLRTAEWLAKSGDMYRSAAYAV